jgi:hypothetical protein
MENPYHEGDRLGSIYKGWFIAPATTNYKFYIACDDYCKINLGNISGVVDDPTEIVYNKVFTDNRDWWSTKSGV